MEYWDVPATGEARFLDYQTRVWLPALRRLPGYGHSELLRRPPAEGGYRPVLQAVPGALTRGIQTGVAVNFSEVMQHEYTLLLLHYWLRLPEDLSVAQTAAWEAERPGWRQLHPDLGTATDAISRELFALAGNHWSVAYDLQPLAVRR